MPKTTIEQALWVMEHVASEAMARAMGDGGTLADVQGAAVGVHVIGGARRKCGAWDAAREQIERDRLADLSRRLAELDHGDIVDAAVTAILITKKPVRID